MAVERLGRGFAWLDAGTYDSLVEAAEFIRVLQRRQGQLIAAPEEIAFHKGWIDADQLKGASRPARQDAVWRAAAGQFAPAIALGSAALGRLLHLQPRNADAISPPFGV